MRVGLVQRQGAGWSFVCRLRQQTLSLGSTLLTEIKIKCKITWIENGKACGLPYFRLT